MFKWYGLFGVLLILLAELNFFLDIAINAREKRIDMEKYEKRLGRRINIEFIDINKLPRELRDNVINGIVLSGHISLK